MCVCVCVCVSTPVSKVFTFLFCRGRKNLWWVLRQRIIIGCVNVPAGTPWAPLCAAWVPIQTSIFNPVSLAHRLSDAFDAITNGQQTLKNEMSNMTSQVCVRVNLSIYLWFKLFIHLFILTFHGGCMYPRINMTPCVESTIRISCSNCGVLSSGNFTLLLKITIFSCLWKVIFHNHIKVTKGILIDLHLLSWVRSC